MTSQGNTGIFYCELFGRWLCLLLVIWPLFSSSGQIKPATVDKYFFKNINEAPFYYDKKKLRAINKYNKSKDWEKQYHVLKDYVSNFGIDNFHKDTHLLWRLAKLSELLGNVEEAKKLYKLVLKHHRKENDIKKIELYYDSLSVNDKDYYVPLDYYYELIAYRQEVDTLWPPRGVKANMGPELNSASSDYGPTLDVNENVLLFTSKRNYTRTVGLEKIDNEDIFYSKRVEGFWSEAKELKEINTRFNEGSAAISRDGKTLYFARCQSPDGFGNCDIYVAKMQADSSWGEISNLGAAVNSSSWDSHPSLNHTEDTLYFASDRLGGFGLSDIYFTYKIGEDKWSAARNLGPTINTRHNEVSPFFHPVFPVLYFTSNGHLLNFGEFDIYKAIKSGVSWMEPKNIGPLVNGKGSEFYFTIDAGSKDLFYAQSKNNNLEDLDLYSFPLPMEAQPHATTKLSGVVTDSISGKPISGIVSIIDLDNGIEVAPKFIRPDGSFEFDLINNNNYLIIIHSDKFFRIEEMFYLEGDTEIRKSTQPITSKMQFSTVEFENGKAALRPEMFEDLDKIVNFLLDNPDFKLRISGHTDSDGSETFNQQLSKDRAESIKEYITYFGNVPEHRVEAIGYGSSKPIVEEINDADKAMNRRVEFEIYRIPEGEEYIPQNSNDDW